MNENISASIRASQGRRILGIASLCLLGGMVLLLCLFTTPSLLARLFLLLVGVFALWSALKMYHATASHIELKNDVLQDSAGIQICTLEEILAIDRGFFAFKPSNGFLLKLKTRHSGVWRPGLWWRFGRSVGIGGMTPASQSKFMAEMIALHLERAKQSPPHPPNESA